VTEPTHFEKFAAYVISNDDSELSFVKAERDYALHCLEREIAIAEQTRARVETLEAALEDAINTLRFHVDNPLYNRLTAALEKDREMNHLFPTDMILKIENRLKAQAIRIEALEATLKHIEALCFEAISYGHTDINKVLSVVARAALDKEEGNE
jgi:hypothetical protein